MTKTNTKLFLSIFIFIFAASMNLFSQEAMMLDVEGNVGIVTAVPQEKLDVNGNIKATGNIYAENTFDAVTIMTETFPTMGQTNFISFPE